MLQQASIFGKKLEFPNEKELNEVCCQSCYNATEEKCACKCNGVFHGLGRLNHVKPRIKVNMELGEGDVFLTEEQAAPFRKQINDTCHCGASLKDEPIRGYPHADGWAVEGLTEKQWLFIKCSYCGFEMSLWKIGVDRNFSPLAKVEA